MKLSEASYCKEEDFNQTLGEFPEEKTSLPEEGDLFVIDYDSLRESVYDSSKRDVGSRRVIISSPTITVVEYLGDGLYKDLVTGFIFSTQKSINEIIDDNNDEELSFHEREKRINHPLAIKNSSIDSNSNETYPQLLKLDEKSKVQIVEKTVPMREELIRNLQRLEDKTRTAVEENYAIIDKRINRKKEEAKMIEEFDKLFITENNNNNNKKKNKKRG